MADSVLLTAGTVATGSELLRPGWIEVRGSEILGVGAGAPPSHGRVRELGNVVVTPGFVDTHVHGGGGGSFTSAAEAGAVADFHARHGTTTLLASLVSAPPDELLRQTAALAGCSTTATGTAASCSKRHVVRGCQNFSKTTKEKIEAMAPAMSTTHGP